MAKPKLVFTAIEDFWSDETESQYCAGLSYSAYDQKLVTLAQQWAADGKVEIGGGVSKISGKE